MLAATKDDHVVAAGGITHPPARGREPYGSAVLAYRRLHEVALEHACRLGRTGGWPLIVDITVNTAGGTGIALGCALGVSVRRVGLPVFLGLAALHTDLHELRSGPLAPVLGLLRAVIALKVGAAYAAARMTRFGPADARAIAALMQCGGVMTIAISLDLLQAHAVGARMHATLTPIGLVTTLAAGPLLPRRSPAPQPSPATAPIGARPS